MSDELYNESRPRELRITVELAFDADEVTEGSDTTQIDQAIHAINLTLQREPYGLAAQIMRVRGVAPYSRVKD